MCLLAASWVAPLGRAPALALTLLLVMIALAHLGWALGVAWPARDRQALALHVIGRHRLPGPLACVVVAAALTAFALAFAVDAGAHPSLAAHARALVAVRLGVVAIFAGRGLFGFVERRFRPAIAGTPYASYSRYLYSPLSLLLAGLGALAVAAAA